MTLQRRQERDYFALAVVVLSLLTLRLKCGVRSARVQLTWKRRARELVLYLQNPTLEQAVVEV